MFFGWDRSKIVQSSKATGARGVATAAPHWPAEQHAEYEKYHLFSSFETIFCTGINSKKDLKHTVV